jgi:F1F0 ATPase subunit 2
MTHLHHAEFFLLPPCIGFAAGALIGASHFLMLQWYVRMLALGRAPLAAMGLQLARFALLAVAVVLIARGFGAVSLVAVTAGILVARAAILRMRAPA